MFGCRLGETFAPAVAHGGLIDTGYVPRVQDMVLPDRFDPSAR